MRYFFDQLYSNRTKIDQDNFLLRFIKLKKKKQLRPRVQNPRARAVIEYSILKENGEQVPVCVKSFLSVASITMDRLKGLRKFMKASSDVKRKENRGGPRVKQEQISVTRSIINHISKFKTVESHYGRGKSVRSYLPSTLNVRKMYLMWKREVANCGGKICSYQKYYTIFTHKFNLGFGSPRSDICSFCVTKKAEINRTGDVNEKQKLITEYRLHSLRAKKFYQIMKSDETSVLKVVFDMQQNKPLPKLNVGEVYYARQIWFYNLAILIHDGTLNKDNVWFYTWTEKDLPRGSNEVVSCLANFLLQLEGKIQPGQYSTLRLFADSCSGQNKNKTMMAFLLSYIQNSPLFDVIEVVFPIRGHSYLPADRIFGHVEKEYRRHEVLKSPKDYQNILNNYGQVKKHGFDWICKDFKRFSKDIFKSLMPIKLTQVRVLRFCKDYKSIGHRNTFSGSNSYSAVLKRNLKRVPSFRNAVNVQSVNSISREKIQDVKKLLKFLELNSEEQEFYEEALNSESCSETGPVVCLSEEEPFL